MTANGLFQLVLYLVVLIALAKPLGAYMARVYAGRPVALGRVLGWLERLAYRLCGVGPTDVTTVITAAGLLALVATMAGILPARRAAR